MSELLWYKMDTHEAGSHVWQQIAIDLRLKLSVVIAVRACLYMQAACAPGDYLLFPAAVDRYLREKQGTAGAILSRMEAYGLAEDGRLLRWEQMQRRQGASGAHDGETGQTMARRPMTPTERTRAFRRRQCEQQARAEASRAEQAATQGRAERCLPAEHAAGTPAARADDTGPQAPQGVTSARSAVSAAPFGEGLPASASQLPGNGGTFPDDDAAMAPFQGGERAFPEETAGTFHETLEETAGTFHETPEETAGTFHETVEERFPLTEEKRRDREETESRREDPLVPPGAAAQSGIGAAARTVADAGDAVAACVRSGESAAPPACARTDAGVVPVKDRRDGAGAVPVPVPASGPRPEAEAAAVRPPRGTAAPCAAPAAAVTPSRRRRDRKTEAVLLRREDWDVWYEAYPRKIKRMEAGHAWNAAIRAGVLPPIETLLAALRWQKHELWDEQMPQYIPYPDTYLNQRRWLDEPQPPVVTRGSSGAAGAAAASSPSRPADRNASRESDSERAVRLTMDAAEYVLAVRAKAREDS